MSKYILPILFLSIFVILLISLNPDSRLNLVEDRKNTPTLIPTPTDIPRQTYRNEKYGFEFQYPTGWTFADVDTSATGKNIVFISPITTNYSGGQESIQLTLKIYDNPKKFNLNQYFIDQKWGENYIKLMTSTTINNMEAVVLNTQLGISPGGHFINIGSNIINLQFSYTGIIDKPDPVKDRIFSLMLTSFKSLPDISSWKTYKSEAYGFEFKYPSNYVVKEIYGVTVYDPSLQMGTNFIQIRQVKSLKDVCDRKCTQESPLIFGYNSFIPFNVGLSGKSFYTKNIVVTSLASDIDETDKIFSTLLSSLIVSNTSTTFCGGIAGIKCSGDQTCQLDGNYPDAGGTCVK